MTKLKKVLPTPAASKQPIPVAPTPTPSAEASAEATPTPSPSPSSSSSARPSPTPSESPELEKPVLPTPPPTLDPEKTVYVDPKNPPVIDPEKFPEPPASPVIITEEPKHGELKQNPNGTFTYTSNLENPKSTIVDEATFQYTSLSGATVIVRKQFILAQGGDVPSLIQTGYGSESSQAPLAILAVLAALIATFQGRRSTRKGR